MKINSHRAPLRTAPSTLSDVRLAAATDVVEEWNSPDGSRIVVVPVGHDGIETIEVTWSTSLVDDVGSFLCEALGGVDDDGTISIGHSRIALEAGEPVGDIGELDATGMRYLTVQVRDVDHEHGRVLALGATEGAPPRTLGETAHISFVRAPDGTWIELSQRASLTRPLT